MSDQPRTQHATVQRDGYTVPLIGIPNDATDSECSMCHDTFHITELEWNGTQMLCPKCRTTNTP